MLLHQADKEFDLPTGKFERAVPADFSLQVKVWTSLLMILLSELSHGPLISFYDWQDDVRRMSQVVVNGLLGYLHVRVHADRFACVLVSVPKRPATTG